MVQNCFPFTRVHKSKQFKTPRLALGQRLCYSAGHILNDLTGNTWFSYLLVFLTKVAGLPNAYAGYVLLACQVFEGICTPVSGVLCDRTVCKYGRRKIWHLLGTVCVTISFPFIFNRCLGCSDDSNTVKLLYYTGFSIIFGFGWGTTQMSHLSLMPEISKRESERVELSALRSAISCLCGIYVYGATWFLLGQSNEATLSPNVWKQFMYLGFVLVGTGTLFNVIFHVGTREPASDALLKRQEERKLKKLRNRSSERTVDCQPPSSGQDCGSGSSLQLVFTSVHETQIPPTAPAMGPSSLKETYISSKQERKDLEEALEEVIIDRNSPLVEGQSWKEWLKNPSFYKTGLVYTCSRLVVSVSQSYLPLYLTETLKFEKEAIAYFPLVVLISGVFASTTVKALNTRFGSKITFSLGCMMTMSACFWFYVQDIKGRNAAYATTIIMGCGGSVMLTTSLALSADLIGHDKKSGAFVYGSISFMDKLSSGIVIAIIQEMNPRSNMTTECPSCDEFVRNVQTFAPGSAALVALVSILLFFDSAFVCKRREDGRLEEGGKLSDKEEAKKMNSLKKVDATVQANLDEETKIDNGRKEFDPNSTEIARPDVQNTRSFERMQVLSFPGAMDNYVASRLPSPCVPSPILEGRTVQ